MNIKAKILDSEALLRIITRMSHEIIEKNKGTDNLVIMGLRTRGEYLATRIHEKILTVFLVCVRNFPDSILATRSFHAIKPSITKQQQR
ncbi:MAG: hypothetical protein IT278_14090 [Ignavibacteriaceae bacterium]|nr:hypothetical protein [Ignavibacteriaceae bacterium]